MADPQVNIDVDFNALNDKVKAEIRRTINALTLKLQRTVQEDKLSGQNLNVQSGRLRGSVSSRVDESIDEIEGTVGAGGTLVGYGFVHEFGLEKTLNIKAHLRTIKKAFGRPITPKQITIGTHTRKAYFLERRFMRDSLDEVAKIVPKNIEAAIERGLSGG